MQLFQQSTLVETPDGFRSVDESADFAEVAGDDESEVAAPEAESVYSDDPVRVYLREMGSVSLLSRQGEVDLARRIEQGRLRVRRVLSRSPLVQGRVMALHEDI